MNTEDLRLKHLDDIGLTIGRMSQNSFIIRGWSVTLVSVVLAIIGTQAEGSRALVLIALAPTLIFWGLDAYYLRQERLFRRLYAAVGRILAGNETSPVELFDMNAKQLRHEVQSLLRTLVALHVLAIPAMLTVLIIVYSLSHP